MIPDVVQVEWFCAACLVAIGFAVGAAVCHAQILAELLVKFYFCLDCGRKVTQASVAYFEFDDFGVPTCVKCHEKE